METKYTYIPTLMLPDGTALDHWQFIPQHFAEAGHGTRWGSEPIHLVTDARMFAGIDPVDPYAAACLLMAHTFARHGMPQDQYGQHYMVTLTTADGLRTEVWGSEQPVGLMWIDLLAGGRHSEPWLIDLGSARLRYALEQHAQRQVALGNALPN